MIRIRYSPELVEECVLLAERTMTAADRQRFRRERDPLYERHSDDRDERFRALHDTWFARLGLGRPIEECVGERSNVLRRLSEGRVLPALSAREEGADLIDRLTSGLPEAQPILAIRLRPSSLLDAASLRMLLRRELRHVDDMLDPAFGYERALPPSDLGPLGDNLVQSRYRAAWNVSIDGRLSREGFADAAAVAGHRKEFSAAFAMLDPLVDSAFDRWFTLQQPTHAALAAFARKPSLDPREGRHEDAVCVNDR